VAFAQTEAFEQRRVTKQEYDEHGSNLCRQRFGF
jgi:actin-related protein